MQDGMGAVGIMMDADFGFDEVGSQAAGRDLRAQAIVRDGVVVVDGVPLLDAQQILPLVAPNGDEAVDPNPADGRLLR